MFLKLLLLVALTGTLSLLQAAPTTFKGTPLEGIEIDDPLTGLALTLDKKVYACVAKAVEASPTSYKGSSLLNKENFQQLLSSCFIDPNAAPPTPTSPSVEPTKPKMDDPFAGTPLEGIVTDDPFVPLALSFDRKANSCVTKAVQQDPEAYKGSSGLNRKNFRVLLNACLTNPKSLPPTPQHPRTDVTPPKKDDLFEGTPLEGVQVDDIGTALALLYDKTIYQCVTDKVKLSPNTYKGAGIQERQNFAELLSECTKKKK